MSASVARIEREIDLRSKGECEAPQTVSVSGSVASRKRKADLGEFANRVKFLRLTGEDSDPQGAERRNSHIQHDERAARCAKERTVNIRAVSMSVRRFISRVGWRSFLGVVVSVGFRCVAAAEAPVYLLKPDAADLFVREWLVVGPFPSERLERPSPEGYTRAGFARDFLTSVGGERKAVFSTATMVEGVEAPQRLVARENGVADLTQLYGEGERRVAYLFTWLDSPTEQTITFFFGSDDGGRGWVNGEPVHTAWVPGGRGVRFRDETFRANLKRGRNALLVKIEQNGPGWGTAIEVLPREKARAALEGSLQVQPRIASILPENGRWRIEIAAGLNHDETLFPELMQQVTVRGTDGGVVFEREMKSGEVVLFEVPRGAYAVLSRAEEPKALAGEVAFLAMEERGEFAKEQLVLACESKINAAWSATSGWFSYLAEKLEAALAANEPDENEIAMQAYRVARWRTALAGDANAFLQQRGAIEWAYRSDVDGSGQPFTLRIPDSYTPDRAWPLVVNMHGAGGTHGSRWGEAQREPVFELFVIGRGRTGGYIELSEVDVLEATDYVRRHWRIVEEEIHLTGGSMGGYGTFTLGARHPDRWATAVPWAGSAAHLPTENMLNLPTYALHSDDDYVVPVSGARAGVQWLNDAGGAAILAETTGLGHQFGRWSEGRAAMRSWREGRARVSPKTVQRVIYTATDELACGAYWARVEEWGPSGKPAGIDARFDAGNALYVKMENARVIKIALDQSPADLDRPLIVAVNAKPIARIEPPLPKAVFVVDDEEAVRVVTELPDEASFRLHFPGGATALYHGEPLMIVYGTQGSAEVTERLKAMAEELSRRSRFAPGTSESGPLMMFGGLPVKTDDEVTAEDLEKTNVILLGSAAENSLAARIAGRMPIEVNDKAGMLRASDGEKWAWDGRGFGLLHFNPEHPQRLVYWVAASDASLYDANGVLVALNASREPAPDFVMADGEGRLVAARRMDSRWKWERGYAESPAIEGDANEWAAGRIRRALGCDFVVQEDASGERAPWKHAGKTRIADLAAFSFGHRLATMTLSGAEMKIALAKSEGSRIRISPLPKTEELEDEKRYRVGLVGLDMRGFVMVTRLQPEDFKLVDITLRDVLRRNEGF